MKKQIGKGFFLVASTLLLMQPGMNHHAIAEDSGKMKQDVIVVYKNEKGKQEVLNESVEVDHEFKTVPAVSATLTKDDVEDLSRDPNIAYVEKNITFSTLDDETEQVKKLDMATTTEEDSWNVRAVNASKAWEGGTTGKGVKVAVLDSGIGPHNELNIAGGVSTVDYTTSWRDDNGHGTHVSGIIAAKPGVKLVNGSDIVGVAPNVELYAIKVLDQDGKGTLQDILEGIDWAIVNGMDIVNMSLGTPIDSQLMHDMVDKAYEQGITIVAASGNDGNGTPVNYPAKYSSVIAVSAVDQSLKLSDFSSTGNEVEFSAPGVSISSTYLNGGYATESGTSQAAPHVAGMLALLKEKNPAFSNKELRGELTNYVKDLGVAGRDSSYGYGFIDYASYTSPVLDQATLEEIEKAVAGISLADQSQTLWDFDSARVAINRLADGKKKTELLESLKALQKKLGLVEFSSLSNMKTDQSFLITFTTQIDPNSVNSKNIFIRYNGDFVQGIQSSVNPDGKSITVNAPPEGFQPGETYFIYIDRTITGTTGKKVQFPVVVMFTVGG